MDHVNPKIDSLTSLRFFAAALIVVGHSGGLFGFPADWPGGIATYQGVTFFFVLSGFILTYVYPSIDNFSEYRRFLIARVARVWPAHFVTMILAFLLLPWVPVSLMIWQGKAAGILNFFLLHAWVPYAVSYFSFNAVSWSISVELFFYLNFGWLIRELRSTWAIKLGLSVLAAVVMMMIWHVSRAPEHTTDDFALSADGLIYISPLARSFEFVIGMCFASVYKRLRGSMVRMPTVLTATIIESILATLVVAQILYLGANWFELGPLAKVLPKELVFWLERSGVAPLYGATILAFTFNRGLLSRLLSLRVFILLGEISYSIYLIHQTLFITAREHRALVDAVQNWVGYSLYLAVTTISAYLTWRFIEKPMRSFIVKNMSAITLAAIRPGAADSAIIR